MSESPQPVPASDKPLLKRLGPAAILGLSATILPPLGLIALIAAMARTDLASWLKAQHLTGAGLYVCSFIILAGLGLLPTYIQCALGGYAFGIAIGTPAALLGFAGGAVIGYEVATRASGDRVIKLIDEKPKWRVVRDALVGSPAAGNSDNIPPGFWRTLGMVALLRLPPNSPFALTNVVMASVKVPRLPFFLGTIIGMAPRSTLAVIIGASLQHFSNDELKAAAPKWVWAVGIGLVILVVLVIGHIANKAILKASNNLPAFESPPSPD
jgi:uncharacterized membrane protein YdjX (TVP38/TMEM64 family)